MCDKGLRRFKGLESKLGQTKVIKKKKADVGIVWLPTQLIEKSGRKRNALESILPNSKASLGSPQQRKRLEQKDCGTNLKRSMGPFLTAVKCAVPLECEQCYYSGGVPLGCTLVRILA